MGWDFWRDVDELDRRTSDPERIAREARAGFAFTNQNFLDSSLFRRASNTQCNGGGDCGVGFACIDGRCTKIFAKNGGSWTPNSCGDDNVTWVCTKGDKSGSNDKCTRPTPGNCDKDPICPGERCCRQQGDGSIRCICGSCEQTDTSICNVYCDQHYKAFGTVLPGCYTRDMEGFGECGGNICDECKFCEDTFSGYAECVLGEQGDPFNPLPCHCFPKCSEECHVCNKDTDSPNFGDCEYAPNTCAECCSISNYECPQCARYFEGFQEHCEPIGSTRNCLSVLQEKLFAACAVECAAEDPCAPTDSFSTCVDGSAPVDPITNPGGPTGVSCPDGKTCQYTGYIEIGGKTCYLYSTWVTADIPERCKECDCNCDNDCGDCEICNEQGKCEKDPDCCDSVEDQRILYELTTNYPNASNYSGPSGCNQFGPLPTRATFCVNNGDAYELRAATELTQTYATKPDDSVRSCAAATGFVFPESTSSYPLDYYTTVYRLYKNGGLCDSTACPGIGAFSFAVDSATITASFPTTWNFRSGGVAQLRVLDVACNQCPPDPGA